LSVIEGKGIRKEELVSDYLHDLQFQGAGVDLSLKEVRVFEGSGRIDFDNSKRKISESRKMEFGSDGSIHLKAGCYKILYNEYVRIPSDCIALAFPRSSLLRCGAFLQCAVWDPGYEGRSESLLVVANQQGITFERNARVVQLVFFRLESKTAKKYRGKYQGENK